MVDRVLLNSSGLKVSVPGQSVLTATAGQLLFSSDWSAMGLIQQGSYTVPWSGTTSYGSIALSKTYASPPFCIFMLVAPGGYSTVLGYGLGFNMILDRGESSPSSRTCLVVEVGTSSIAVSAMYYRKTSGITVPVYDLEYYVFDNNQ